MRARLFLTTFLCFILTQTAFTQQRLEPDYIEGRVIVKFKTGITVNKINSTLSSINARQVKKLKLIGADVIEVSNTTTARAVQVLKNNPAVEFAHPDYIVHAINSAPSPSADSLLVTPNDPLYPQYWGLNNTGQTGGTPDADIDAPEAWDIATGSDNEIIIGVIDTGVDWNHEDLKDNMWVNPGEIPGNGIDDDANGFIDDVNGWDFVNNDNDPFDDNGHGTHVSGTAGAVGNNGVGGAGVNWSARIMALKFLSGSGSGSSSDAILAIEYAIMMGANLTNNSWGGGGFEQALFNAIQASGNAGMLFIAAAGNDAGNDNDINPHYPSSYDLDNIIAVASTDHNDNLSTFSSFGLVSVDLAAPGTSILSTFPNNSYGTISGTSMATPHVSGVASLLWSYVPGLDAQGVKDAIMASADPLPALQGLMVTGGRLNAFNALLAAEQDSIPPSAVTDLEAVEPGSNTMLLTWTATGDDTTDGTAKEYDIRFSTSPITEANFDAASVAPDAPEPQEAGTPEAFTVAGLDFNTTYYFALRVFDEQGNGSGISNVDFNTTLGIPVISVAPDTVEAELFTGETAVDSIAISNDGEGTLDFEIPDFGTQAAVRLIATRGDALHLQITPLPKQERQPGARRQVNGQRLPVQRGASGMLPLLQNMLDNLRPDATIFFDDFEGDDQGWTTELYFNTSDGLWHETNFSFNSPSTSWWCADETTGNYNTGSRISNAAVSPEISLATAQTPITLEFFENYTTEAGFDRCMVDVTTDGGATWTPLRGDLGSAPSGNSGGWIMTSLDISDLAGETIKIRFYFDTQDGVGNIFQGWFFDDVLVTADNPPFVSVAPAQGSVPANVSENVFITFNAAGLFGDVYQADIIIESNDPITPQSTVTALLTVIDAPDIALSSDSLGFGDVFVDFSNELFLEIANVGTDTLEISDISSDNEAFTFEFSSASVPPGESVSGNVKFAPTTEGAAAGALTISSNDPDQPSLVVALTGNGVSPSVIAVSPAQLNLFAKPGDSTFATLSITNNGGSDLFFNISDVEQSTNALVGNHTLFWGVNTSFTDTLNCGDLNGGFRGSIRVEDETFRGIAIEEAGQRVYWASDGTGEIRSSNFDGSDVVTIISGLVTPVDVAIDPVNKKLYWADFSNDNIGRSNFDGSDQQIIITGAQTSSADPAWVSAAEKPETSDENTDVISSPWGITLDIGRGKIYWTEQGANRLSRANLDGSNVEICVQVGLSGPRGIEYDPESDKVYFVDSFNKALKMLDPETKNVSLVKQLPFEDNPLGLEVNGGAGHIYWADNIADYIARVDFDGNNFEIIAQTSVPQTTGPFGLAIAAGGWLTEAPLEGVVPAGVSAEILVTADASNLEEGDYEAVITVSSNDPATPEVEIPVFLKVAEAQVIVSTPIDLEGLAGDTLDVPVFLTINDTSLSVSALGAALKISSESLSYIDFTAGPILTDQMFQVNPVGGDSLRIALVEFGTGGVTESGLLATLHFETDSNAVNKEMVFLNYNELSSAEPDGTPLITVGIDGKVTLFNELFIEGVVFYSAADGGENSGEPVQNLTVNLTSGGVQVDETKTAANGDYLLEHIKARKDYFVNITRKSGGRGFAVNPTDALVTYLGTLDPGAMSGSQKLAADVDADSAVTLADAQAIFDRFLGFVGEFGIDDWRAFPASYDINQTPGAWTLTPTGIAYPNLKKNQKNQDYLAVVIGDANLSWVPVNEAPLLAKNTAPYANRPAANFYMNLEKAPTGFGETSTFRILVSGEALKNGVYAFGGDLEFDSAHLEIIDLRWGNIIPGDGFQTAHGIHDLSRFSRNENSVSGSKNNPGILRFGGFTTASKSMTEAGVLLEIDVRLKNAPEAGGVASLRITDASAAYKTAPREDSRVYKLQGQSVSFVSAQVEFEESEIVLAAAPAEFALAANYPNPFNPSTNIRYQLAEFSRVKLEIYNMVGQKIATLVNDQPQKAGFYTVEWNARDIASGMYLYRIEVAYRDQKFTRTHKMLLLK